MEAPELSVCPGCGCVGQLLLDGPQEPAASPLCSSLYFELYGYTLSEPASGFIHQVVVDTYRLQHAGNHSKPLGVGFALIGLYLVVERGQTGRQAQLAHMELAKRKADIRWPEFEVPRSCRPLTVEDVLAPSLESRNAAILDWASSVWIEWQTYHSAIRELAVEFV